MQSIDGLSGAHLFPEKFQVSADDARVSITVLVDMGQYQGRQLHVFLPVEYLITKLCISLDVMNTEGERRPTCYFLATRRKKRHAELDIDLYLWRRSETG